MHHAAPFRLRNLCCFHANPPNTPNWGLEMLGRLKAARNKKAPRSLVIMKKAVVTFVLLIGVLIAGLGAVLAFATGSQLRPVVQWTATQVIGRTVSIEDMSIERGEEIAVTFSGLVVKHEKSAPAPDLVVIDQGAVTFRLWELLRDIPTIRTLRLEGADIHLARGATTAAETSQDMLTFPQIAIKEIGLEEVRYQQSTRTPDNEVVSELSLLLQSASGTFVPGQDSQWDGRGVYLEEPFDFSLSAHASALMGDGDVPITASVEGAITATVSLNILQSGGLSPVDFETSGPTVAALSAFAPVPLPETPPFSLAGRLHRDANSVEIEDMAGTIGDSDISGSVRADLSGELPYIAGSLSSSLLDFDDLAPLIGGTPNPTETASPTQRADAKSEPLIPDATIPADLLRTTDFSIELRAEEVSSPLAQVEAIAATATLSEGRLLIKPLTLTVSGGTAAGEIALNVREETPSADIDLTFDAVSLSKFFSGSQFAEEMGGILSGKTYLLGVGNSFAEILSTSRGQGHLILRDGQISALIVEGAGLDVAEALGVVITGDDPIAMPCAGVSVTVENGEVTVQRAAAATRDSLIRAVGGANLDTLAYRIKVEAEAWDFSLLDLNAPVVVTGDPSGAQVSIGQADGFPLFAEGVEGELDCATLTRRIIGN